MTVQILPAAFQQIERLPLSIHRRVLALLERLERWPQVSGVKPLRDELSGKFRLRTGDYRVQFYIQKGVVVVEKVGHRDGFYE